MELSSADGIIVVDIQRDFCPGGALPVPEGDDIVPLVNELLHKAEKSGCFIVYTRDWHPQNHMSFKTFGGTWPEHCVQWTAGAEFHPSLYLSDKGVIISKGTNPEFEAYSGFQGTDLDATLKANGVHRLFIVGLATDYCVKETALDSLQRGYDTYVVKDAVRGVNVHPNDSENALNEMEQNGAKIIFSKELLY